MMNRLLLILLLMLPAFCAEASDRITATVTITNAPTTNGMTFIVNSDVRTWTNSVYSAATQILTNDTAPGVATNLYNHLVATPPTRVTVLMTGPTNIVLYGATGDALVLQNTNYYSVTYSTQTVSTAYDVLVPYTVTPSVRRQTITEGLVDWLNLASGKALLQSSASVSNLVGLTNSQTISGAKTWTGVHHWTGSNYWADNVAFNGDVKLFNALGVNLTWSIDEGGSASFDDALSVGNTVRFTNDLHVGGVGYIDDAQISGTIGVGGVARFTNSVLVTGGLAVTGQQTNIYATGTNSFSDIAFRRYAITSLANGNNAGIVIGTNSFVEVSGPTGAFTINGMTGSPSRDGHFVIVLNQTGQDMTVAHQSGTDPTAANRIITMTGADRSTTGNGAAMFIYSASAARWLLISLDP